MTKLHQILYLICECHGSWIILEIFVFYVFIRKLLDLFNTLNLVSNKFPLLSEITLFMKLLKTFDRTRKRGFFEDHVV